MKFNELIPSGQILQAIDKLGFEEATPIQEQAIPMIMKGRDVVGQAQTGTGKTAAFAIPTILNINTDQKKVQSLILCPTRELAVQISEEIQKLAQFMKGIKILPIFGGQDMSRQIRAIKQGAQIIIGTPGRVLDHLRRKTLSLDHLVSLTLDEADEMLKMGFREDIETVLSQIGHPIQTMLFSATMPPEILKIIDQYQQDPEVIQIKHKAITTPNVQQIYLELKEKDKVEIFTRLVDMYQYKLTIVFCNTKRKVDEVCDALLARGYAVDKIHGDMKQTLRLNVINKLKRGDIEILVATDVAARGLDIDDVEAVFNFDLPTHEEYYVHRIGRTGRAGKEGVSYSFVTFREFGLLRSIQRYTKSKMNRHHIPKISDIHAMKRELYLQQVRSTIDAGLNVKYIEWIERLTALDYSMTEIAAALFQLQSNEKEMAEIDSIDFNRSSFEQDIKRKSERGSRKARRPRRKGMARIQLNVGKKHKVRAGDIVGAIANEVGISGSLIGNIDIAGSYTRVDVPSECVGVIMERMKGASVKGKKVVIERLRKG